ncbi:MAG: hypothetical protein AAB317_03490, partial [Nitrospirota bacterium]
FTVKLDAVFPSGITPVTNSAVLASAELPTVPSNPVTTNVTAAPKLSISKVHTSQTNRLIDLTNTASVQSAESTGTTTSATSLGVIKGTDMLYTISYANNGNAPASNVIIVDALPVGSVFVSATGAGLYDLGTHKVTWGIGTVLSGGIGSVTVTIRVGN